MIEARRRKYGANRCVLPWAAGDEVQRLGLCRRTVVIFD